MKKECLEILEKLDECMKDSDFQIIIIMKFLKSLSPLLQSIVEEDEKNGRNSM